MNKLIITKIFLILLVGTLCLSCTKKKTDENIVIKNDTEIESLESLINNNQFGYQKYKNMELIGNRIRVPYKIKYDHFTTGGFMNNILYNPGWATGNQSYTPIFINKR